MNWQEERQDIHSCLSRQNLTSHIDCKKEISQKHWKNTLKQTDNKSK